MVSFCSNISVPLFFSKYLLSTYLKKSLSKVPQIKRPIKPQSPPSRVSYTVTTRFEKQDNRAIFKCSGQWQWDCGNKRGWPWKPSWKRWRMWSWKMSWSFQVNEAWEGQGMQDITGKINYIHKSQGLRMSASMVQLGRGEWKTSGLHHTREFRLCMWHEFTQLRMC